uniref:Uncharacterized protein n=1 Tax=Arundo donax TaxID=35708 RepID=A0A0A9AVS5_ARUDO
MISAILTNFHALM